MYECVCPVFKITILTNQYAVKIETIKPDSKIRTWSILLGLRANFDINRYTTNTKLYNSIDELLNQVQLSFFNGAFDLSAFTTVT
ncbi:hypothetical protein LZY01_13250 [Levilactobacillus zymae]|uniref:Uncharacterized protein n=1 Tax=Levilactobacillus zymae TaxID=267363 RepID=A0ABQ0X0G4_9LACO|nr:hypothetical protein LZY01_13250 [Levilactobacillus zymae]